jgi:hypothetical protein
MTKNAIAQALLTIIVASIGLSCNKAKVKSSYWPSGPIIMQGKYHMLITNIAISNLNRPCITLVNCNNIIINHCKFSYLKNAAIYIYHCKNITIKNCYMEHVATGIYALKSQGIKVNYNKAKNIQGPYPKGQMVQFDEVSGPCNQVNYNRCENVAGASSPEDVISMYKTNGTPASPVQITGNWIRGGGPNKIGGGIMLGDRGGSYITVKYNRLVNPGQYGIAISGGTHMDVTGNRIFSRQLPFTNVGIYVWAQASSACGLNKVAYNRVNWARANGELHGAWNKGNCGKIEDWDTNTWHVKLNERILPDSLLK